MGLWLRMLAVLPEDQNSVPRTHTKELTTSPNSRCRASNTSRFPLNITTLSIVTYNTTQYNTTHKLKQ